MTPYDTSTYTLYSHAVCHASQNEPATERCVPPKRIKEADIILRAAPHYADFYAEYAAPPR